MIKSLIICMLAGFALPAAAVNLKSMSVEEKALLLSGDGWWQTHAIERLDIPSIYMTDGPHGLRKASGTEFTKSVPATAFPTLSALGATWNTELLTKIGTALGKECQANDVQILLGPAINMKRSPLAGRNFEYFSEDPVLTGKLAAAYVNGLQAEGVGASVKHFAVNNQEFERMETSSNLDEQTLREIYLQAFEIVVKEAQPWSIMSAYNKINGVDASESPALLQTILRDEWGFKGFVVSDWGAVNDRSKSVNAGVNLEMPGSGDYNRNKIVEAVKSGKVSEAMLNQRVNEILSVILKAHQARKPGAKFSADEHHALALEAAREAIVLLKNSRGLLPLNPARSKRIALIGAFAKTPRIQGAGSSQVNPLRVVNAFDELQRLAGKDARITFTEGYMEESGESSKQQIKEAVALARASDVAIVFAGLPDSYESEGFDRATMDMPKGHNDLIQAVAKAQAKTVVVLTNGSAVAMPWLGQVPAVLEGWLGGQAGGTAIAEVLLGKVNPSGKLSETFPVRLADTPAGDAFPAKNKQADYREGRLVGYRHYLAKGIKPLFPFGFGLSYTRFSYSLPRVQKVSSEQVVVKAAVKNSGQRAGAEVVQLYVGDNLRGFEKVSLQPGETKVVNFELKRRDFSHFNRTYGQWMVNAGKYNISIGGSSRDLPLKLTVNMSGDAIPLTSRSPIKDFETHPKGKRFYRQLVTTLGLDLEGAQAKSKALTPEQRAKKKADLAFFSYMRDLPVGKLPALSQGKFGDKKLEEILSAVR